MILPGWTCPMPCGCFNGEAKERRERCRACESPRPKNLMSWEMAKEVSRIVLVGSYDMAARMMAYLIENGTQTLKVFDKE